MMTMLAAMAAALAGGPSPCKDVRLHLRCPNLVMAEPRHVKIDRETLRGRVLLRATSSIDNVGTGPIRLVGRRRGPTTMRVRQVIYDRHRRPHGFRLHARLDFKLVPGARYDEAPVPAARYWKLRDAARFELWRRRGRTITTLARRGPKVDYCLRDLDLTHPGRRSPHRRVFGGCNQDPGARRVVLGTSVGWSDVYPFGYPEQWIDVTGLRGRFALVLIADPDHRLLESNPDDDASAVFVELPSGRVVGHRVRMAAPGQPVSSDAAQRP